MKYAMNQPIGIKYAHNVELQAYLSSKFLQLQYADGLETPNYRRTGRIGFDKNFDYGYQLLNFVAELLYSREKSMANFIHRWTENSALQNEI